jgi:hypothetical protein
VISYQWSDLSFQFRDLRGNNIPARKSLCRRIRPALNGTLSKRKSLTVYRSQPKSLPTPSNSQCKR